MYIIAVKCFELPYSLLTCTSSSRTKSLQYFIVEIFLLSVYQDVHVWCVCAWQAIELFEYPLCLCSVGFVVLGEILSKK